MMAMSDVLARVSVEALPLAFLEWYQWVGLIVVIVLVVFMVQYRKRQM